MRLRTLAALLSAALFVPAVTFADVKSQERTQVKFEGALGRMMNFFGGKTAREGLVSTVALKGNRLLTITGDSGEIIDLGSEMDIIQKSGAWYSYNGAKIAQGRDAAKIFLQDNPEVALEIEQKIKEKLASGSVRSASAAKVAVSDDDGDDDDF